MTSIELALAPRALTTKQPTERTAVLVLAANRSQRAGRALCVLLSSTLLAGWIPNAKAARAAAPAAKTPQRTEVARGSSSSYEVRGKRYRVLATSDGYRERGVASWYGDPFDGRPTSSGEMYDMHEMTAAHPTLPIPTWVEVTNLANGKHVVVKVNDRGPFVGKRLIDLSLAAATALDMVDNGTAHVEVRALSQPPEAKTARSDNRDQSATPPKPKSPPEPLQAKPRPDVPRRVAESRPPPATDAGAIASARARSGPPVKVDRSASPVKPAEPERLFAEAGKFTTRDDAAQVVDSLKAEGFVNAFVVTEDGRRKSSHRVRVGPLSNEHEVESMNDRLRELGVRRSRSVTMH